MGSHDATIETLEGTVFLDLKTVQVNGGVRRKLNIRNVFFHGFLGKIRTIYYWLRLRRDLSFKGYLELPVRYVVEDFDMYYNIDAEAELTLLLEQEANENKEKN